MKAIRVLPLLAALMFVAAGCGGSSNSLTVYSGREEEIIAPLIAKFEESSDVSVEVRYGSSAELAAQIDEEGGNSPADVFFAQDAGSLGSVSDQLEPLPQATLDRVPAAYRAQDGGWVGTSGRVRVVVYNTDSVSPDDLPDTALEYSDPQYAGRLGIAPQNASFQAFVTAMRITYGDDRTKQWLEDLKSNGVRTFDKNRPIVEAVAAGDIDLGLVNHYYLALVTAEQPDAPVANKFLAPGDPGTLVNVAGVGILNSTDRSEQAQQFVDFLLSDEGQIFYTDEAEENEYPLVPGIRIPDGLPPLDSLAGDSLALTDLGAEEAATLKMIDEVGFDQ